MYLISDDPESTDSPVTGPRKIMSDAEQRSVGTVLTPGAGCTADGRMIRTLSRLWAQSGEAASVFAESIFESEYLGHDLKAFEGLPAWAVPLPEDFDEEKHVGRVTRRYALERRLHVCIEIDPSPKKAWLKPILDTPMENWIRDPKKRLYGVNKLWEAYDFLCYWALDVARTGVTYPLFFALDDYTQNSIRNLRLSVNEQVKLYEECVGSHATDMDEGWIKKSKGKGKKTTASNVKPAFRDDEPNDDQDTHPPPVSKWHGHRSSNLSIKHRPGPTSASTSTATVPTIPTPRQHSSSPRRRRRIEQSNTPPAPAPPRPPHQQKHPNPQAPRRRKRSTMQSHRWPKQHAAGPGASGLRTIRLRGRDTSVLMLCSIGLCVGLVADLEE
ncbi:hypothetical protein F4814DRAFT_459762 [Daldinia grandis]|nr:hypothetical protein F4814DRAFT_459762 [Daldinia grandis]